MLVRNKTIVLESVFSFEFAKAKLILLFINSITYAQNKCINV